MPDSAEARSERASSTAGKSPLEGLLPALQRLDHLLERAVETAQATFARDAATDSYRGLYIGQSEVEYLLAREPGAPTLHARGVEPESPTPHLVGDVSLLARLGEAFALSAFELDVLLIALAPDLDLRYERLYAYLQDDVTRRRPSVDLALNLLCASAVAKLTRLVHFAAEAPLVRHGLLHLLPDPHQVQPPLLSHALKVDAQLMQLLLGQNGLDERLAPFCQLVTPTTSLNELPVKVEVKRALAGLAIQARETRQPLRLYFYGPPGVGKRRTAEALAGQVGVPLLVVNARRLLDAKVGAEEALNLVFRAAWFQDAMLYLDDVDTLRHLERAVVYQRLLDVLAADTRIAILAGREPWPSAGTSPEGELTGMIAVPFAIPDLAIRRACWQSHAAAVGIELQGRDLDALADRFRLTPAQIAEAMASAYNHARWRTAAQGATERPPQSAVQPTTADLFAAARAASSHELAAMARKIEPVYVWEDLVLPHDTMAQLQEICQRVVRRHQVLGEWGFGHKLSLGQGVNALFAGPSGTGKTMAAEIIANALGLELYKIDLSHVVSKYIGETEKNLDRIFTVAENANAILFFDEADALFGKRSEVRDAHDRYANIEIAYLLQKAEEYDGIAILATNLRQNMDEAFVRRLQFIVEFPLPDEEYRERIWQIVFPRGAPRSEDLDLAFLARKFKLTGGNIKNIVLTAAFLAAQDSGTIGMEHLIRATRRELQKMGKLCTKADFGEYYRWIA